MLKENGDKELNIFKSLRNLNEYVKIIPEDKKKEYVKKQLENINLISNEDLLEYSDKFYQFLLEEKIIIGSHSN